MQSMTTMSLLNFGQAIIITIGVTFIMIFASSGVVDGSMTLGDLVLVNALMLQLFVPLNTLGIVYRQITYALADMNMLLKLLDKDIEIIGINYKDAKVNAKKFLNEIGNPYQKIIFDKDGTIAIEWGAYGVPETYIIYNNKIIKRYTGPINAAILR